MIIVISENAYKYVIRQTVKKKKKQLLSKIFCQKDWTFRLKQCWNTDILSGHLPSNIIWTFTIILC